MTGLRKLGETSQGRSHEKCRVEINGKTICSFPIPSDNDFNDTLIGLVRKPLSLTKKAFCEVCECTKDAEWYRGHLESRNLL